MKPILKINFLFLALAALLFIACEKEDFSELTSEELEATVDFRNEYDVYSDEGETDEFGRRHHPRICFDLVFPVTVNFPNGSSLTVENEEELRTALRRWKAANPDAEERPEFEFPVQIERRNGEVITIERRAVFMRLVKACKPDRGPRGDRGNRKDCFDLVFPVTINFPDGTSVTAQNDEELREAMKAWKEANPDAEERPEFDFPIDVTLEDGTTQTVADAEAFRALIASCGPRGGNGPRHCFDLVFPVTMSFPDGSTVTAQNNEELREAMKAWKEANPDSEDRPEFVFPIDVTLENGTTQTIADAEAFRELIASCGPLGGERPGDCFDLVFPVTLDFPDGTSTTVEDAEALRQARLSWRAANIGVREPIRLALPVDVILEDGTEQTITTDEAMRELLESCRP